MYNNFHATSDTTQKEVSYNLFCTPLHKACIECSGRPHPGCGLRIVARRSKFLHIGGREDTHLPVDLSLPPVLVLLLDQVYDIARLDGELVRLVGSVVIQRLALAYV